MNTRKLIFSLFLLLAIFLAACSSQAAPTESITEKEMTSAESSEAMDDDSMMDNKEAEIASDHDDDMMGDEEEMASDHDDDMMDGEEDEMMSDHDDDMMEDETGMMAPDWFSATLTNAKTGETFTISDFKGKVVLVETLAMWCSNCFKQQSEVYALHNLISNRDDFVSLGIDIDPNENAEALKAYTIENGFTWLYTVAPAEVSREISQLYGDQFLNPPSTPMLIIDRQGEVHPLPFGIKSAESLLDALQPFLDSEM
jgi:peroxiredoxin